MKEGRNGVYYITGESVTVVSSSFFLETMYLVDPTDKYAVHQFKEFEGEKLESTTTEDLGTLKIKGVIGMDGTQE